MSFWCCWLVMLCCWLMLFWLLLLCCHYLLRTSEQSCDSNAQLNFFSINLDIDQDTELTISPYIHLRLWDFFYLKHSGEIIVFTLQSNMIPCFIIYLDSISWASDQSEVHFPADMWKFIWFVEVAVILTAIICDGLFFFFFF